MSGTSLDGVDGVLAHIEPGGDGLRVLAHVHQPMPMALRHDLLSLNHSGPDELHRAALAANALAREQAVAVERLLAATQQSPGDLVATGSHGQTVRHRPGEFDGTGYTLQLNQPALLAELTGVDVVSDFRSRDVAAGGQGAPLVPAFHAMLFGQGVSPRAVLNLGGIGNLSLLPAAADLETPVRGFDCGPGNALLDHWIGRHKGLAYDDDGHWAASGRVHNELLSRLLAEPFLQALPPKSTGRDLFNPDWLTSRLGDTAQLPAEDVQATLAEFTAATAAQSLQIHGPEATELLVCGGGALNSDLMRRLASRLPGVAVRSTSETGLPPMQVEAAAFAWLAWAFVHRQAGNLPAVTGARGPRVLGALYPAH